MSNHADTIIYSCIVCIVLYLYIYIAPLAEHTNQKLISYVVSLAFQCERPREKRAVLRKRKETLGLPQWRSNGRFSRFKEPGPPTVRGPRPLVRQAVSTSHSCKTQVQRDR